MLKRVISIAVAALMIFSMAAIAVSAADVNDVNVGADGNTSVGADTSSSTSGAASGALNFDASGWKNHTDMIYCHIWERGGDSFFPWGSKKEYCTKNSDGTYGFDLSKVSLESGKDYCVLFYDNTKGTQTYDTTFSSACAGDVAKLTGKQIENPVDSEKKAYEMVWTKNSSNYGPHLAISSIGNIIGSKLCPNEKSEEVIGDWVITYYKSTFVKAADALAKAYPKFGITSVDQIETIFGYVQSKESGEDEDAILKALTDGFAKAYPSKKDEVKDTKEIKQKAAEKEKAIKSHGGHVTSGGSGSGSSSSGSSSSGSSSGSGSYNSSGSGSDGQEDTILFVLAGVMLVAGGAMFMSRKKREE